MGGGLTQNSDSPESKIDLPLLGLDFQGPGLWTWDLDSGLSKNNHEFGPSAVIDIDQSEFSMCWLTSSIFFSAVEKGWNQTGDSNLRLGLLRFQIAPWHIRGKGRGTSDRTACGKRLRVERRLLEVSKCSM